MCEKKNESVGVMWLEGGGLAVSENDVAIVRGFVRIFFINKK